MSMGAALGQAMRPHWGPTDIFAPASAPAQSIFELSLGASAGREDRSDSQPPEQDVDRAARDGALPGNFKMNWTCTTARPGVAPTAGAELLTSICFLVEFT